jgi:excisionase family DNA binding protein
MSADQAYFDFLVPVTKELLRVDEVMTILRVGYDVVYGLVEAGKLEAHQAEGRRTHYRITRRSVVAHLASTAKYEPKDFLDTLQGLIKRLPADQRDTLIRRIS